MRTPFGFGPNVSSFLPSERSTWTDTFAHAPTSCSLLIFTFACPSASPAGSPSPRNSSNIVVVVSVLSRFIIFLPESSDTFRPRWKRGALCERLALLCPATKKDVGDEENARRRQHGCQFAQNGDLGTSR